MSTKEYSENIKTIATNEVIHEDSWIPQWLSWRPTSQLLLFSSEAKLLSRLKSQLETFYVPVLERSCRLRTIIARSFDQLSSPVYRSRVPIVLVHGMGAGIGFWCKNMDPLAQHRPVYAMDVLGFGRSSRPAFPEDAEGAEDMFVETLEEWREQVNLDKFVLVGHSMGGYLTYSYAIRYPDRVSHLIMVDPWGFTERPDDYVPFRSSRILRSIAYMVSFFNPLSVLRLAGPLGPSLVRMFRKDLGSTFNAPPQPGQEIEIQDEYDERSRSPPPGEPKWLLSDVMNQGMGDPDTEKNCIFDYIYHCNAQTPSGEAGFKAMSFPIGWAVRPMLRRVPELHADVPVTFIYGGRSWMDSQSGFTASFLRTDAYTDVRVIDGAGHHVYAQGDLEFNAYLNSICARVDSGDLFRRGSQPHGPVVITRGTTKGFTPVDQDDDLPRPVAVE